mmetsp:Transcript_49403/g.141356  ORF Transcript_49403/g.141356 Transcript_49403/m.141356 type:complete len:367 (+) Transcript_49403:303-1403(+)
MSRALIGCSSCFCTAAIFSSSPSMRCSTSETLSARSPPRSFACARSSWSLLSWSTRSSRARMASSVLSRRAAAPRAARAGSLSSPARAGPRRSALSSSSCRCVALVASAAEATCSERPRRSFSSLATDLPSESVDSPLPPVSTVPAAKPLSDMAANISLTFLSSCWCSSNSWSSVDTCKENSATAFLVCSAPGVVCDGGPSSSGRWAIRGLAFASSSWWAVRQLNSSDTRCWSSRIRASSDTDSSGGAPGAASTLSRPLAASSSCAASLSVCANASFMEASMTFRSARKEFRPSSLLATRREMLEILSARFPSGDLVCAAVLSWCSLRAVMASSLTAMRCAASAMRVDRSPSRTCTCCRVSLSLLP